MNNQSIISFTAKNLPESWSDEYIKNLLLTANLGIVDQIQRQESAMTNIVLEKWLDTDTMNLFMYIISDPDLITTMLMAYDTVQRHPYTSPTCYEWIKAEIECIDPKDQQHDMMKTLMRSDVPVSEPDVERSDAYDEWSDNEIYMDEDDMEKLVLLEDDEHGSYEDPYECTPEWPIDYMCN